MIELKLHLNSYPLLLKVATALAAAAPEVLMTAQTTGMDAQGGTLSGQQLSAGVTSEKQEAARQSAQTGTAASPPPATTEKRGPGRPSNAAKAAAAGTASAPPPADKPKEPALTYANSGISERIGVLAADPNAKTVLLAKIKEVGGVGEENGKQKTSAKFIPAAKLAEFRDWLAETFPVAVEDEEEPEAEEDIT